MLYLTFITSIVILFFVLVVVAGWPNLSKIVKRNTSAKHAQNISSELAQMNVESFRSRLSELDQDRQLQMVDDEEYEHQKLSLQKQLLQAVERHQGDRAVLNQKEDIKYFIPVLLIPVLTIAAYFLWQDRSPVWSYWKSQQMFDSTAKHILNGEKTDMPPEAEKNVVGLLQTLQTQAYDTPNNAAHWYNLGLAYRYLQAFEPALQAFSRAERLDPKNIAYTIQLAQTDFYARQGQLTPENKDRLNRVLAVTPDHEGAMMLLAMDAYRNKDFNEAIKWLQTINQQTASRTGKSNAELDRLIVKAKEEQQIQAKSAVKIEITLATELASRLKDTDTLFIYVRPATGTPMPFAAMKLPAKILKSSQPVFVTLSDQNAMMPERTLSKAQKDHMALVVGARVSQSGGPVGAPGDLESETVEVNHLPASASLKISKIRP